MSPTNVQVRPATAADRDAVIALLLAQFREHQIDTGEAGTARAVDGVFRQPDLGRVLIATLDGKPVGLAALSFIWTFEHGGRAVWLEELYVEPAQRDHGIGRTLLQAAYKVAAESGATAMDLEVEAAHRRAERLYEREGFVRRSRARWTRQL
jgi:GNAT superfamily N-acetyltransferase